MTVGDKEREAAGTVRVGVFCLISLQHIITDHM